MNSFNYQDYVLIVETLQAEQGLKMDLFLRDKTVAVTGAARGIGAAIARAFRGEGAAVLLIDRDRRVTAVAEALGASAAVCDLAAPDSAETIARRAEALGGCDVLVNNAGVSIPARIDEISDADWQTVMGVNLDAAFRLTRELWPQLAAKAGAVVNIASFAAKRATLFGRNASYTASKHGLAGLTRAAAMDGASMGVRVNAIAPGVVDTDLVKQHDAATRARIQKMIPLGAYAQPAEIADLALFLSSKRAAHITGEVVNINGGLLMD